MFPTLKKCLVRGAQGDYFLQRYLDGSEYKLSTAHAYLLHTCNGINTLESIAREFGLSLSALRNFFQTLIRADLLEYRDTESQVIFPPLSEAPYLQEVQIEGTGECNLWCKHCYAREAFLEASKDPISLTDFSKLINQLWDANVARVFLSGGEIFLRDELPAMIEMILERKIHLSGIFTNGTIQRSDVFEILRVHDSKTTFLVSLDGHTSAIHDFIRGVGSFVKTISFIKDVVSKGFKVTVNTVANIRNVHHLNDLRIFCGELGVSRWRVSVQREQGEAKKNATSIEPLWDDLLTAYMDIFLSVIKNPNVGPSVQLSSVFKTEFLNTKRYYLYRPSNSTCEYKRNSLVVASNGNVLLCPAGYAMPFGNVRSELILDVWRSANLQAFKTLPIGLTMCRDCDISKYCGSGCRIIALQKNGSLLAKDTNACILYRFFHDKIEPILNKHGVNGVYLDESPTYLFDTKLFT